MLFQPEIVREFAPSDLVGNNAAILADALGRQARASATIGATGITLAGGATDTLSLTIGDQVAVLTFVNGAGFARTAALAATVDVSGGLGADRRKLIQGIGYALSLLAGDLDSPAAVVGKQPISLMVSGALNATPTPAADTYIGGGDGFAVYADAPVSIAIGAGVTAGLTIDA